MDKLILVGHRFDVHAGKRKPPRGTLVRYQDRIVEVLGEARGQRIMIRSIHADGTERLTAVKLMNLRPLDDQLF